MHREKREIRYYKIRVDVAWGIVLCLSVLILIAFWGRQGLEEQENEFAELGDRGKWVEVNYDGVRSQLLDVEQCHLCGNSRESLMGYYRKFDTIGLISHNDWYVVDFPLKAYDENGNEIEAGDSGSVRYGNTGEISYAVRGMPSRGMAEIEVTLLGKNKVDIKKLQENLCQWCLDKVADSLEYWKWENEEKEAVPLCVVDFETLDIYSLQDMYCSYFVRDYFCRNGF